MILTTSVDAYVKENAAGQNYGKASKLWVNGGGGSDTRYAYLFFSRPFPPGVNIELATLRLVLAETWGSSQTLTAKRIVERWNESRIKWNDKPAVDGSHSATVNIASLSAGTEVELDLAAMLDDVAAGGAWYGVRLELSTDANRALFSSDHPVAANRPTLEVEWSQAPAAPSGMAPAGGLAVSKTKPLLTWAPVDDQVSSEVEVSTSTDFSSPSYASGEQANTLPRWDLSATAFSALAADAVRYWRVRVKGSSGEWSDWSETQQFTRKTLGTLTITNPDTAPDNFVEETTPPIAWTFTGRTQTEYAVTLYREEVGGGLTELAKQARVAGTEVEWNVPAGILRTGDTYVAYVAVWDEIDRANLADDVGYVLASQSFTYQRSGAPSPVTALAAEVDGAAVILTFERSSDPDYFSITVDGVEVLDRIEPGDVFVSGDTYRFVYWLAQPRQTHLFEVEAVVNDGAGVYEHSDGNATDSATTTPIGIWLADPVESLGVFIAGKEKTSMTIGEIAGRFDIKGSRAPVKITDVIQGYRGTFNGILLDAEARDDFLELKGRLVTLRLIIGDLNIPIDLGEIAGPMPVPTGDASGYDVGFAFEQVDEFFPVAGE